ncbi:lipid A deacylase LpxR family protein [Enterovibrio norvegicus]|uniref:lipid A deacylase LpxR family protein n=1 Tax=Enterovibrio norvegicus TaxID=188144 RepID=UPI0024B0F468|nr:lipid A deacylase LpxR family protein [Enterovibrio norvegicus]
MLTRRLIGAAIIAAPMFTFPVHAATVSLSIDNDGVIGTDREYTSGLFLRWSSDPGLIGYSIEIGQQMWTPSDIELTEPLPNERAYAGFLYTQARLYQQTDTFALKGGLLLGTVGPNSGAETGQSIVHTVVGSPDPQGWDYQIYDEFIYQLSGEAHQLIARSPVGEFSVFGRAQGGNFQSEVAAGGTYRLGIDLGNTFGSTSVIAGNTVDTGMLSNSAAGMFFFTTLEARYRFDDVTIEGDKPAENSDLTIENIQGAASAGFTWYSNNWGATASATVQSKQYETAKRNHHAYGNFTLFYRY